MKILMLTLYLPYPPTSGGQIRSYNLIKHLSKKHEITLYSVIKKGEERYAEELRKYCKEVHYFYRSANPFSLKNILRTGLSLYPFLVMRNMSDEGRNFLAEKLKKDSYDLIHVETFYLRPHLPPTDIPIVLVDQTIEFQVYQHFVENLPQWFLRPLLYLDVAKLRYWEARFWREANRVVAVSEADKRIMQKCVPEMKVGIVPNAPGDDLADLYGKRGTPDWKKPVIFFQSNFLWMQNVEGARILTQKIFPLVKKLIPNAVCRIVGQHAGSKTGNLRGNGVEIVSLENADIGGVRQAYLAGTVFVAPLLGPGGTRLKILSAMAVGMPVVATPVGAQGIEAKDGEEILIGRNWQEMAEEVVALINDKDLYMTIAKNARRLIKTKYNWEKIADKLGRIYEETARED